MSVEELVLVERHDGWAEVTLNRPERRNAIIQPLAAELRDAFRSFVGDDELRAVVLRGAGGAFCSGLDLTAMNADPKPDWLPKQGETWREAHVSLFECPAVVIGALERYAINAGAALALGCDLLIVGEGAYIQVGEVQQGVAAPMNLGWLRAKYGEALAARMVFTGRRFLGPELQSMGVATESVADDQVIPRARELATELASYAPAGLLNAKAILRALGPVDDPADWFQRAATSGPHKQGAISARVRPT